MRHIPDPDIIGRDNATYWAAALAVAIRMRDSQRITLARRELRRLRCPIDLIRPSRRKGARHAR